MLDAFLGLDAITVISLSHSYAPGEVCHYPGDPEYRSEAVATLDNEGYALNYVSVGEHTGTHWGAPAHFNEGEPAAHELDPEDFFLPGALIDVQAHAARDENHAVGVDTLEAWESAHGPFPAECAVILNTGWHKRWPTERYTNLDANGTPRHPGFSPDAVEWLLDHGVLGRRGALGTDAFSPDVGADDTFAVSKALYREHRLSLEVLTNLDQLPPRGFWLAVGGFVSVGGNGSPAAVHALLPKH